MTSSAEAGSGTTALLVTAIVPDARGDREGVAVDVVDLGRPVCAGCPLEGDRHWPGRGSRGDGIGDVPQAEDAAGGQGHGPRRGEVAVRGDEVGRGERGEAERGGLEGCRRCTGPLRRCWYWRW